MPFNLLILPLLGGFIFVTFWNRTKIRAARYQGYRLILYSSIWGGIFLFFSLLFFKIPVVGDLLDRFLTSIFSVYSSRYSDINLAFLSFIFGCIAWIPLNVVFTREREYEQAVRTFGNRLERLLFEALKGNSLVAITLKSRKVYIGYILKDFNPEKERAYLVIWPVLSGFRESDSLNAVITTNYASVYSELGEDGWELDSKLASSFDAVKEVYDFSIYIRVDEIISVNSYDIAISAEFDKQRQRTQIG